MADQQTPAGVESRRVAIDALVRIDKGGAYANLILPKVLDGSALSPEDRRFVTELVYGTTRMQRACDHLVDRFLLRPVEPRVRAALRLGAYQLAMLGTPPHAALDATVGAVGGRARSLVNAVLRRVADAPVTYPDRATELSYPDWIVERFKTDWGSDTADRYLQAMNTAAATSVRDDGYVQDPASQAVVAAVDAAPGDVLLDLCAAPGGKATGLAAAGAHVVAADLRPKRVRLMAGNIERLAAQVPVLVADGRHPPIRSGAADKVLIDAPCSGLGSLRRRADARWRIDDDAPERLARLQVSMISAAWSLLRPGGTLTYSVCTLTRAETVDVLAAVQEELPDAELLAPPPGDGWGSTDGVAVLAPDATDGMMLFQLRRSF